MVVPDLYVYAATVRRIVDGDTVDIRLSCGMDVYIDPVRLRLCASTGRGIDSPEVRGPERPAGLAATNHLRRLVADYAGPDGELYVRTFKDKSGKYGRLLADLFLSTAAGPISLCDKMVQDGHAVLRDY